MCQLQLVAGEPAEARLSCNPRTCVARSQPSDLAAGEAIPQAGRASVRRSAPGRTPRRTRSGGSRDLRRAGSRGRTPGSTGRGSQAHRGAAAPESTRASSRARGGASRRLHRSPGHRRHPDSRTRKARACPRAAPTPRAGPLRTAPRRADRTPTRGAPGLPRLPLRRGTRGARSGFRSTDPHGLADRLDLFELLVLGAIAGADDVEAPGCDLRVANDGQAADLLPAEPLDLERVHPHLGCRIRAVRSCAGRWPSRWPRDSSPRSSRGRFYAPRAPGEGCYFETRIRPVLPKPRSFLVASVRSNSRLPT